MIYVKRGLLTATDETVIDDDQVLSSELRLNGRELATNTLLPQSLVRKDEGAVDVTVLDESSHVGLAQLFSQGSCRDVTRLQIRD
jgi:hypothetical protein